MSNAARDTAREFAEAIVRRAVVPVDGSTRVKCALCGNRGCRESKINHEPDCIVLKAKAYLAAQAAGEEPHTPKQVRIKANEGGDLILTSSEDMDMLINLETPFSKPTRFCTRAGGGQAPETRKALFALMDAMIKDGGEVR